ncbi:MAG: hypothetical protein R3C42_01120 [Parvularculaceae bacterium]
MKVAGDFAQTVVVGNNSVSAVLFSKAKSDIGGVNGAVVSGDLDRTIYVGSSTTRARFLLTKAETKIGTIENTRINGDFKQTIHVNNVVTDARHFGKSAKTCIGTLVNQNIEGGERTVNLGNAGAATQQRYVRFFRKKVSLGPMFGKSQTNAYGSSGC